MAKKDSLKTVNMLETQEFIIVLKNDTEETRSKLKKLTSGNTKVLEIRDRDRFIEGVVKLLYIDHNLKDQLSVKELAVHFDSCYDFRNKRCPDKKISLKSLETTIHRMVTEFLENVDADD